MASRLAIKLRQLQYFLAIAETLHFSKAAEKLFVTQSTLSHQLAELETQIGKPLVDRAGKTVRLTQIGEIFRVYAKRSLDALEAGCSAIEEFEGVQRGLLRIGVTQSFIHKLMPPILAEFMSVYPGMQLAVEEMTAPKIEQRLADGLLDLGIAFAPAVLEETELEPILEERLLLVTGKNHRLASHRRVPMKDLKDEPLTLLTREFSTRRLIERYFEQLGLEPLVVCETNNISLMVSLARESRLATIVPESAVDRSSQLHIVPIYDPIPMRVSALLWSKHNYRTKAAQTFAQLVRDRFQSKLPLG
jgi:LysR family cyn operon transcriptional activator